MAENDRGRPDDSAGGRKKALIVSMLIFLLFGGGIFLVFVIQGADDLKDNKMKNFSYSSKAGAGVSAFMKYLGFTSDEAKFSQAARGRIAARGPDSSASGPTTDISGWMDKGGAGAGSSGGLAAPLARALGASVPRMAAKGAGLGSTPPKEITELGNLPKPEGKYCPAAEGCSCCGGATFRDNAPTYQKGKDGWQVIYTGRHTDPDGSVLYYKDVCNIDPSGKPPVSLVNSFEGSSSNNLLPVTR